MPAELLDRLVAGAWRSILVHELAHLKRRDHWVGLLELLAACLWWWNPVFWYTRRRLREDAELACDAWVVALQPQGRRAYAQALLSVLESSLPRPQPVGVLGMGAIGKRLYERRLAMIFRDTPRHRLTRRAFAAVAALALAVLPGWAQTGESTSPELPVEKSKTEEALERATHLQFENRHRYEITDFMVEH